MKFSHLSEYGALSIAKLAVEGIKELKLPIVKYIRKEKQIVLFRKNGTTPLFIDQEENEEVHTALTMLQEAYSPGRLRPSNLKPATLVPKPMKKTFFCYFQYLV